MPCTLVLRTQTDDDSFYEETSETFVDTLCEIQQRQRDEPIASGELSRTIWDAYFLPDVPRFKTGDALLVEDEEYEVTGDPWVARNSRTGGIEHIEATLVRTVAAGNES